MTRSDFQPGTSARPPNGSDLAIFLSIAFGGSWGLAALCYAAGFHLGGWHTVAIGVPYMFFPAIGALVAERRRGARVLASLDVRLRPNLWWAVGVVGAFLVSWLGLALSLAMPETHLIHNLVELIPDSAKLAPAKLAQAKERLQHFPVWVFLPLTSLQALVAGVTINAVAAFGEELGWRGYLHRACSRFGFWKGSWLVGLVWGPWHFALIVQGYNYPEHPHAGLAMMTLLTVLLAPLIAAVRVRGHSVIAAAVTHGTFNASAGFASAFVLGDSDLTKGMTGVAGLTALALMNLALLGWMRMRPALWLSDGAEPPPKAATAAT